MSHELRTPLNAVLGFSEVMKGELSAPPVPAYKEYAERHPLQRPASPDADQRNSRSLAGRGRPVRTEGGGGLAHITWSRNASSPVDADRAAPSRHHRSDGARIAAHLGGRARGASGDAEPAHQRDQIHAPGRLDHHQGRLDPERRTISLHRDTGPGIPHEEIPIVLSSFGRGSLAQKKAEEGRALGCRSSRDWSSCTAAVPPQFDTARGNRGDRHLPARTGDGTLPRSARKRSFPPPFKRGQAA